MSPLLSKLSKRDDFLPQENPLIGRFLTRGDNSMRNLCSPGHYLPLLCATGRRNFVISSVHKFPGVSWCFSASQIKSQTSQSLKSVPPFCPCKLLQMSLFRKNCWRVDFPLSRFMRDYLNDDSVVTRADGMEWCQKWIVFFGASFSLRVSEFYFSRWLHREVVKNWHQLARVFPSF